LSTTAQLIIVVVLLGSLALVAVGWYVYSYFRFMTPWFTDVVENPQHRKRLRKAGTRMLTDVAKDIAEESVEPRPR
jgi:hypothetical protein